jgi:hypothetical protein
MAHYSLSPDISGQKFGMWTVVERRGSMPYGGAGYLCRCDCGSEKLIGATTLRKGNSTGCGCVSLQLLVKRSTTHGLTNHPLYGAWCRMKDRCYYEKHLHFDRYGGRGIKVCERWLTFENFYSDNLGRWKPGLTLDRENNDGDYSPDNCRWTTRLVQTRNRSNTVKMTLNGETLSIGEWAERIGVSRNALYLRRRMGWSDERSLTTLP